MSVCTHQWERAPDRDRMSVTGFASPGTVGKSFLVFWCPKCGTAKTEMVDFDAKLAVREGK